MFEAVIPIALAGATGFSVLISRLHSRVSELDKRVDFAFKGENKE